MALLKRKRSGLTDPMSVVTRFVNACNRHDAEGVAACLHLDFDSIQPMYPARNFRGADQVRRNWQAIFEAEPGFRLTVLRQAAVDDTVWLELHGAGQEAEVAGVFVMGIQGDRVRWARIYSALIEPLPPGYEEQAASSPATLRQVPPMEESPEGTAAAGAATVVVEEELIAPVVDIEGGGRSRRRRSRRRSQGVAPEVAAEPVVEEQQEPEAVVEEASEVEPVVEEQPAPEPVVEAAEPETAEPEPVIVVADAVAEEPAADLASKPDVVEAPAPPEPVADGEPEPEPSGTVTEPEPDGQAVPALEVVDAVEVDAAEVDAVEDPDPVVEPGEPTPPVVPEEHGRSGRWLGRKRR